MKKSSIELKQYAPTWTQSLTVVVFTVATVFVGNLSAEDKNSGIESTNFCQGTAGQAFTSCKSAARSDYQVALGKCINITDPAARTLCERQAAADLADGLDTCQGGLEVRQASCQKLGPDRYDPPIDPTNFTTTIDNPYFPLVPGTTSLEPDALEDKYYAPGVGNVLTVDLVTGERDELVSITTE